MANIEKIDENQIVDYTRKTNKKREPLDVPFLLLVLILLTLGVIMLLSSSYARAYYSDQPATLYFSRQLLFAIFGLALMFFLAFIPVRLYKRYSMTVLFMSIALLILVLIIGTVSNGSRRWIDLGAFTIQPSEIAKLGVILSFSYMACAYKKKMKTLRFGVVPFAIVILIIGILLILEPHLSATIIIVLVGSTIMFLGGTKPKWFIFGFIFAVVFVGVYINYIGYASDRFTAWQDPFKNSSDKGYQIAQSLIAIGSGGLNGLGFGNSRQKYLYLPEEHNDYIFSIICEELGYIGAVTILVLFALLIIRGFWLAMHCTDRYEFLVCSGITMLLAVETFLNVAVVTNLIPSTGVSLPFFSYGGTALLLQLAEMGIILSISKDIPNKKQGRKIKT